MTKFFDLAFAELPDGSREQPGYFIAERCRDLRRTGEQEITRDDRLQVAPFGVHRLDTATSGAFVHDIVVVERPEVDEFARDGTLNDLV